MTKRAGFHVAPAHLPAIDKKIGEPPTHPRLYHIINKFDVFAPGHTLSAIGRGIVFDPSRGDEGVWLERRVKKHGPVQVAKARLLTVESDHLEFMFDDPIPKGTYFLAVYTRHGKDTGYAPTRICRQIKTLPCARH